MVSNNIADPSGNGTPTPDIDVNKHAWPQGVSMTRQPVSFNVDGIAITVPAQGTGNMFHHWLAWLNPKLRPNAYKLMNAGFDCYETYQFILSSGKTKKPGMRKGALKHGK